jgi:hypothetical protein
MGIPQRLRSPAAHLPPANDNAPDVAGRVANSTRDVGRETPARLLLVEKCVELAGLRRGPAPEDTSDERPIYEDWPG